MKDFDAGMKFLFPSADDVGIEWVIVNFHPEDHSSACFVPIDTFPLVGTPDIRLGESVYVARCGESEWFPLAWCNEGNFVGKIDEAECNAIRKKLNQLATGRLTGAEPAVDFDPEYEEWIRDVQKTRESLCQNPHQSGD